MRLHIELPDSFPYDDGKAIVKPLQTLSHVKIVMLKKTELGVKHTFYHDRLADLITSQEFGPRIAEAKFFEPQRDSTLSGFVCRL